MGGPRLDSLEDPDGLEDVPGLLHLARGDRLGEVGRGPGAARASSFPAHVPRAGLRVGELRRVSVEGEEALVKAGDRRLDGRRGGGFGQAEGGALPEGPTSAAGGRCSSRRDSSEKSGNRGSRGASRGEFSEGSGRIEPDDGTLREGPASRPGRFRTGPPIAARRGSSRRSQCKRSSTALGFGRSDSAGLSLHRPGRARYTGRIRARVGPATGDRSNELRRGGVGATAMFCMACGKEIPNEARFCNHCVPPKRPQPTPRTRPYRPWGRFQAGLGPPPPITSPTSIPSSGGASARLASSSTLSRPPRARTTGSWVVAFRDYRFGFYRYPVHAAELACLNDCGLRTNAFPCSRCGSVIASKNIQFRFPSSIIRSHILFHFIVLLLTLPLALIVATMVLKFLKVPLGPMEMVWRFVPKRSDNMIGFLSTISMYGLLTFFGLLVLQCFSPFTRYNFAQVARAAKQYAKEEARSEAVRTAKATARATKDIGKPWFPENR